MTVSWIVDASRRESGARAWCILLVCGGLWGCSRSPEYTFTPSEEVGELPKLHQENIAAHLRLLFGTPSYPKFVSTSVAEEEAQAEGPDPADEGGASPRFADLISPYRLRQGALAFQARCAGCHGVGGDGAGEAAPFLRPKPRDYRRGIFKFASTPYGTRPVRQDLVRIIRRGAKGTSMPAFPWMPEEELQAIVDYVILLSQRGEVERILAEIAEADYDEDEKIEIDDAIDALDEVRSKWERAESQVVLVRSAEPAYTEESIRKGRELFISDNCWKCHGKNGEGQIEWLSPEFIAAQQALPESERVEINYDAWGDPAPAANLTARMLHGGRRALDIYRRIHNGINGTPMPAFGQIYEQEPEKIWHLVHYIRHIIEGGDPELP